MTFTTLRDHILQERCNAEQVRQMIDTVISRGHPRGRLRTAMAIALGRHCTRRDTLDWVLHLLPAEEILN